jgi:hypothetical protein
MLLALEKSRIMWRSSGCSPLTSCRRVFRISLRALMWQVESSALQVAVGQPSKPLRCPACDAQCQAVFVHWSDDLRP